MDFFRPTPSPSIPPFRPELRVIEYVATTRDEPERGPQVRLSPADAKLRLLSDGELAWVQGARGQQLAELIIDDSIPQHSCALRDVPGVVLSESVCVLKPDLDSPRRTLA